MKDTSKLDFNQEAYKLAQELVAADSSGKLKITPPPKSYNLNPDDPKYSSLKLDNAPLVKAFGVYSTFASSSGEEAALLSMIDKMIIPLEKISPEAFEIGLKYMEKYATIFPKEQQKAWRATLKALSHKNG